MGWSCRRPGCSQPAAFSITYDAVNCQVWISALSVDDRGQLLCELHRQRLSPPRGWVVIDRAVEPQVVQSQPLVSAETEPPERPWGQLLVDEPVFTTDSRATLADPEPDGERVDEEPADDVCDDVLGSLLAPKGGLLGRAFRATGHQRSVLTEGTASTAEPDS